MRERQRQRQKDRDRERQRQRRIYFRELLCTFEYKCMQKEWLCTKKRPIVVDITMTTRKS